MSVFAVQPERNNDDVQAVTALRAHAEEMIGRHQRRIEHFTSELGRPRTLYWILAFVGLWVGFNLSASRFGLPPFDRPPFPWLQGLVGLGALLMTTTVLTTQNRQTRRAEQRGQLELQVNLLAEQKVAKVIGLLEELRRDIPSVRDRVDREAEIMTAPINPHAAMAALEQTNEAGAQGGEEGNDLPEGGGAPAVPPEE